jgi:putative DNA primase/helicase
MNLWRGFAAEQKPGDWSLFRNHIEKVVCSGVANHADYVPNWLARLYQQPSQPGEVALILRDKKAAGRAFPVIGS